MAEWVDEAALPVNAPGCFVIADPVDTAIGSSRHGAFDEAVRVIDEHLNPDRSRTEGSRGVPAVVLGFAEKERRIGNGQSDDAAKAPQLCRTKRLRVPSARPRRRQARRASVRSPEDERRLSLAISLREPCWAENLSRQPDQGLVSSPASLNEQPR